MHLFVFGLGYTASRIAAQVRAMGGTVEATGRAGTVAFEDDAGVAAALSRASHVLSSVPPDRASGGDPVLDRYGQALAAHGGWLGYLSSTGVYGDTGGAWVDESAGIGSGRRGARAAADLAWQRLGASIFRLPGIYGPGRSALERVVEGKAHRVALSNQVFSRVHVDDIVSGVLAAFDRPQGVFNLADDRPTHQNAVIEAACALLALSPPPLLAVEDPALPQLSRAFYAENRRVANGRAKRFLGWRLAYPDFAAGLRACMATSNPISAMTPPPAASQVQR